MLGRARIRQDPVTVGDRGPATLENYQFLEKISHFDRERIPERVVHARGFVAHGYFEAYGTIGDEPASTYTRAKLFSEKGKRTPVVIRYSTVIGSRDSPETSRDPRGFAVKFKTEDGNWDLVGNDLPVFFIRDAIKFPDVIHSLKPDPVTFRQDAQGEAVLVKYHWKTQQGIKSLTQAQANEIQATDTGHASKDIFEAIERGDHPRWELCVQIMSDDDHPELDFDPLDDTKTWPEDQFPLRRVGMMTLDRNVSNHFAENEQAAFGTGVLVDGLDFSDDKVLVGRTFSYSDTQRYRVGPNYLQLPINAPVAKVGTNQRDGQMAYYVDSGGENPHVNYEPSSLGGLAEAQPSGTIYEPEVAGRIMRRAISRTNNYGQATERYRTMPDDERDDLILNFVDQLGKCEDHVAQRMLDHFAQIDDDLHKRVSEGLREMSANGMGSGGMTSSEPQMAGKPQV